MIFCFYKVLANQKIILIDRINFIFRIENIIDFLFLKFSCQSFLDDDDWDTDIDFSSCFILSEFLLVSQILTIEF